MNDSRRRGFIDQRPGRHPDLDTIANLQLQHFGGEFLGKGVIDASLNIDPIGANTGLPCVAELGNHRALNRPVEIHLPLLVEMAEKAGHPMQEEAMNILDVILGPDYTENRAGLRDLAKKYLAEQAAENADAAASTPPAAPAPQPAPGVQQ